METQASCQDSNEPCYLLLIPPEILENVASYLTYDEISSCRLVCQKLDKFSQKLLNQGFHYVEQLHDTVQKEVKRQLPRRESERRTHPLARHVEILASVETRLSLLSMTYSKHISASLCCFIPGKVLDELLAVLRYIRTETEIPRSHEFLQELRDISSMAMEHFDENILPGLKSVKKGKKQSEPSTSSPESPTLLSGTMPALVGMKMDLRECRHKLVVQNQRIVSQSKLIRDLRSSLVQQNLRMTQLSSKVVECEQKFTDVFNELAHLRSLSGLPPSDISGTNSLSISPDSSQTTTKWESSSPDSHKRKADSEPQVSVKRRRSEDREEKTV